MATSLQDDIFLQFSGNLSIVEVVFQFFQNLLNLTTISSVKIRLVTVKGRTIAKKTISFYILYNKILSYFVSPMLLHICKKSNKLYTVRNPSFIKGFK